MAPAAALAARHAASGFVPRTVFALPSSLPRSYFLGHHKAGLDKMKTMLSQIDLVIECRDYRIPITGRNTEFERVLGLGTPGGKSRIVVYTKYDLGVGNPGPVAKRIVQHRDDILTAYHAPDPVHFSETLEKSVGNRQALLDPDPTKRARKTGTIKALLDQVRSFAKANFSLTGHRVLVAGMPNVGKSTLLNALRKHGIPAQHRSTKKAAKTGADPGVTRNIGSAVKILERDDIEAKRHGPNPAGSGAREATGEGVYLLDTPGVFMPYVPDSISMLKLALCGAVKDTILPPVTVADYLLFSINRLGQQHVYGEYSVPTNDITELLQGVAKLTGRLGKRAEYDLEGAAIWLVKRWRQGRLGKFQLDTVDKKHLELVDKGGPQRVSFSQAIKQDKHRKSQRAKARPMAE